MIYRITLKRGWDDITFDVDNPIKAMIFSDMAFNAYSDCEANEGKKLDVTISIIKEEVKDEASDSDSEETESTEESV